MSEETFSDAVEFPSVPEAEIPEDASALRAVLSGQHALQRMYACAQEQCVGEAKFLGLLLARDFAERFDGLVEQGTGLLASIGAGQEGPTPVPQEEQIVSIAQRYAQAPPEDVAPVLSEFASRTLICQSLVPWKSESQAIFEYFRASLEAEDCHLGVVQLFARLVGSSNGTGS